MFGNNESLARLGFYFIFKNTLIRSYKALVSSSPTTPSQCGLSAVCYFDVVTAVEWGEPPGVWVGWGRTLLTIVPPSTNRILPIVFIIPLQCTEICH
jgi:hypothetical protein